jgi:transcriptional regulator with AAA-type ATPase domain
MHMALFDPEDRTLVEALSQLVYANPFLPERVACERAALGKHFSSSGEAWFAADADLLPPEQHADRPNVRRMREESARVAEKARARLVGGHARPSELDLERYADLAAYALYSRYEKDLWIAALDEAHRPPRLPWYRSFARDFDQLLRLDGYRLPTLPSAEHAFALFFQIRRAFHHIFRTILGSSAVVGRLRAETWRSVFTHDLRRYHQGLYLRMHDIPTLIVGASGTGKDLVARAIGMSRYIPFDSKRLCFVESPATQYFPLNLSALSPALIESELFGHRRGAFTGALEARSGWLEACGPEGTVFLDEIGELQPEIQVKLLRVLQSRGFQRIGETTSRMFLGKIVAATHRDLDSQLALGRFREDFYYRLCADRIDTPTLRERLDSDPDELLQLVGLLARRVAGDASATQLAREVVSWIEQQLGRDYAWPGNVRELEQCVRNVLVRREYRPIPHARAAESVLDRELLRCGLSAQALVQHYASLLYEQTGNYVETGRRLGLDRRTVKEHLAHARRP